MGASSQRGESTDMRYSCARLLPFPLELQPCTFYMCILYYLLYIDPTERARERSGPFLLRHCSQSKPP